MSRDFIGSLQGRSFRQSQNRDRITRTGVERTDWLVFVEAGGSGIGGAGESVVLMDGMEVTPTPPAGFVFEDLRLASNGGVSSTMLFPGDVSSRLYCRNQESGAVPKGTGAVIGTLTATSGIDTGSIVTRLPPGSRAGYFRASFRVWGLSTLANLNGSLLANSFVSRFGSALPANPYSPPDYTVFDKNPVAVFKFQDFTSNPMLSQDFDSAFGGIPLNTFTLDSTTRPETKELYSFDRRITCSVTIGTIFGGDRASAFQATQFPDASQVDGAVIERTGATLKSRIQHRNIHRPNGNLLNPASPIIVPDVLDPDGNVLVNRTNVFPTGKSDTYYFPRAGFLVHLATLDRIPAYEAPTLTVLRQDLIT